MNPSQHITTNMNTNISTLTKTENRVLNKRLNYKKLTQVESNYLSRSIRPKLRNLQKIKETDIDLILKKIEYNQKGLSIEKKIVKVILESIADVEAIILYGSAIQTNYYEYNDIDILIVIKENINPLHKKIKKIIEIKKLMKKQSLDTDIQIYNKKTLESSYSRSPSLIYQLKDSKTIYGSINLPTKIELHNLDLKMKLDWSYLDDSPQGVDIYNAIRNTLLVRLLLHKIVDNQKLKEVLNEELGKNIIERLKNNKESKEERKLAIKLVKELSEKTRQEIKGELWEKIEL